MTAIFQHLHHVCIVVHDLDRAVSYYESLGVGPWFDYPKKGPYLEFDVPSKAASGFFSSIIREPLAGQDALLPVEESVRHWFASPRAAIGFLLGEEVGVLAHVAGLLNDRSTLGTARSAASSISQSSAGVALASPATSSVGKVACLVLYWVAVSL